MTQTQINALLLGLFGASGPLAKILALVFHMDDGLIHSILEVCTLLTPTISGAIFTYMQRPTGVVNSVASLTPVQQNEALTHVSDAAKLQIAEAVPAVATIVVKDTATDGPAKLAQSDNHPNIVTETQNEADAKKGTKVS